MNNQKNIYFASDFHLGSPNHAESLIREKRIVAWLDQIKENAKAIYLVGDIFDFWFEYKHSIPKGYSRFFGKIAELTDSGIEVHFFTGNHDMWMFDYFEKELNVTMHRNPIELSHNSINLYVGHGDGLGPGDKSYKVLKKVFSNPICQWLFARLHPNFGIGLANYWSGKSREHNTDIKSFLGEDKEWLAQYCKEVLKTKHYDYFIFGHRHLPIEHKMGNSTYINLGEWMNDYTYAMLNEKEVKLLTFNFQD